MRILLVLCFIFGVLGTDPRLFATARSGGLNTHPSPSPSPTPTPTATATPTPTAVIPVINTVDLEVYVPNGSNHTRVLGRCSDCGAPKFVSSIDSWCSQYSGWSAACCKCIVQNESGGDSNNCGVNSNGSHDVGLWQINTMNWPSCSAGKAPCDPNTNLGCAKKIFGWGGNTWKLWSTCSKCGCCSRA